MKASVRALCLALVLGFTATQAPACEPQGSMVGPSSPLRTRALLVNWDDRVEDAKRIKATLAKNGLTKVETWALQSDFEEKMPFNIDREWMGEMPYAQLFKRNGEVWVFAGEADIAELEAWAAAR